MRGNRKVDTRPELAVRSALHRAGLRFRKSVTLTVGDVRVRPDVVFPGRRVALFVDGCFWHGCPDHGTQPRVNRDYWRPKLRRNVRRDRRVDDALQAGGWLSLRIWEHDVQGDVEGMVRRVQAVLRERVNPEPPASEP